MQLSMRELLGYNLDLIDGEMGSVDDFYFDDTSWAVRYLVAKTGPWLIGRKVLIAPSALGHADSSRKVLEVAHTKDQIKDSPDIDFDRPVSRQHEIQLHTHYQWVPYWSQYGLMPSAEIVREIQNHPQTEVLDPHLRSLRDVLKYSIHDAEAERGGKMHDFIVDDVGWRIVELVADLGSKFSSKQILMSPRAVTSIEWNDSCVNVAYTFEEMSRLPEYDASTPINADVVIHHLDYKGREQARTSL